MTIIKAGPTADTAFYTRAYLSDLAMLRRAASGEHRALLMAHAGGQHASAWEDLAMAGTSGEFTAAFAVLHAGIIEERERQDGDGRAARAAVTDVDPGDPAATALARLALAASAVSEAGW